MAWEIYWIIVGLFTQAHGFSTTVVKEGGDAIIECGIQTTVEEGYLKWEAITNDTTVVLAYDIRDGFSNCNDRIINCTIHTNGSIHLESVSKEDGARYYRCLQGDDNGYNYYSDHRLLVLSKEKTSSPPSIETPHRESVISYNMGKKGVLHGYNAPVCEDDVDVNLPVVCYPPSGIIVDIEYETIQCNCTDSDGQVDNVTFPVSKKMSSPPSIEVPHRESGSSYNMGKKGVLHGYNAPVCEDDVDGNLPVVCYPPSGIIVDIEYETIQCNCTDSDGLMDSVTFPVSRQMSSSPSIETPHRESVSSYNIGKKGVLHGYSPPVCDDDVDGNLPVVCYPPSGIIVDREYETIQCNCTDSDGLMDSVTFLVTSVTHGLHSGWTAFIILFVIFIILLILLFWNLYKNHKKLKEYSAAEDPEEMTPIQSGTKDKQISDLEEKIATLEATLNNSQTELTAREAEVSDLKSELEKKETEMKTKLEEQNDKTADLEEMTPIQSGTKDKQISDLEDNIATLEATFSKRSTQSESQVPFLEPLHELMEMIEKEGTEMKKKLEELNEQSMKFAQKLTATGLKNRDLNKLLEEKQDQPQKISDWNQASCKHQSKEEPKRILEVYVS